MLDFAVAVPTEDVQRRTFGRVAQALERGAWDEARTRFQESLAARETPQAMEQLGLAAWWLDDAALTLDARERAFRRYRDDGDPLGAARVALWLVWDYLAFRGDAAVAAGWLERARRLLEGHERSAEYGWLLLRDGEVALFRGHDPATARARGERAAALGRDTGDRGLEFTGLALEGLARVSAGELNILLNRCGVRLVILNACQSAALRIDPLRSIAPALIRADVPAVVAMQLRGETLIGSLPVERAVPVARALDEVRARGIGVRLSGAAGAPVSPSAPSS